MSWTLLPGGGGGGRVVLLLNYGLEEFLCQAGILQAVVLPCLPTLLVSACAEVKNNLKSAKTGR